MRKVEAFVEKPDAATAARYVADGYLWNSGNFMFRAEVMLRELARLEPEIRKAAKGAVDQPHLRSRFLPARRRPVRPGAEEIDRLRGDGTHRSRGGAAGRRSAGPTSAAGTRCGTPSRRMTPATSSKGRRR